MVSDKQPTGKILPLSRLANFVELSLSQIKIKNTYIHTSDDSCTIIWYLKVGVKQIWQVYVASKLKIKLFCFFILSTIVWIFIGVENTFIDCVKICNNSKRTKTSRNEVMQPTTRNNHSQPIVPKPCPQPGRFCQVCC